MSQSLISILEKLSNPSEFTFDFDVIIEKSDLIDINPQIQLSNIIDKFNNHGKSIMVFNSPIGKLIPPNQFRLVALNKRCELIAPSDNPSRLQLFANPNKRTEDLGFHNQTELCIGAYGSYLINVPMGKLALIWRGNMPSILGHGPHVIHDQNFKPIDNDCLKDYNNEFIKHGIINILRILPNSCGKIWINNTAYFLTPKNTPYVFKDPTFKFDSIINLSESYINHGSFHILQVPDGKLAKVWLQSTQSFLLESSKEPYYFQDPSFRLDVKNSNNLFEDSVEPVIVHGSIKRILPKTGQVAITYDNGKLITYTANKECKPVIIKSNNHSFEGFLPTNIQTIQFPSQTTIKQRIKEDRDNNDTDDEINYEVFRTSDGLPIGVKILVIYEIENPDLTLNKLNPTQITQHIEHIVVADMGLIIQNCSSVDFLKSNQPQSEKNNDFALFYQHLQDKIFKQLQFDFGSYGIKLVRLNIETPKILDKMISSKMAEFSLMSTEARAKESVMDRNFNIAKQQATQEVTTKQIMQQQENDFRIKKAQSEYNAMKIEADGLYMQTEMKIKGQELELEISRKKAEMYDKYPSLFELELVKTRIEGMKNTKMMIISPEIAQGMNLMNFKSMAGNFDN